MPVNKVTFPPNRFLFFCTFPCLTVLSGCSAGLKCDSIETRSASPWNFFSVAD